MKRLGPVSLRAFNTFSVDARAKHIVQLESEEDLQQLQSDSYDPSTDLVLGGGSNILFAGDVEGTLYLMRMRGREIVSHEADTVLIDAGAGESWHELVLWSLQQNLNGLENLSLIPGLVGAAPMQNIGAYGVELSDLLDSVLVMDWQTKRTQRIHKQDCDFAYRNSRFRSADRNRFLILSVRLRLSTHFSPITHYSGVEDELASMGISQLSARHVSDAVIRLRTRKLPDPTRIGNAGSFFKNPIVDEAQAAALMAQHEGIPVHRFGDEFKLSAAWLIESCGWKGFRNGDAGVSDQHALVLVNHGGARGGELVQLAKEIVRSVEDAFGVRLEPEPLIHGASF